MKSATLLTIGATIIGLHSSAFAAPAADAHDSMAQSTSLNGSPRDRRDDHETHGSQGADAIVCQGLLHMPQGDAQLQCDATGSLVVSNIGSSGQDGVSIDLGEVMYFQTEMISLDVAPPGSSIEVQLDGTRNYGSPQPLGGARLMSTGASWLFSADMTPIGIDMYSVAVFDDGEYVGTFPVPPGTAVEFHAAPVELDLGGGDATYKSEDGCSPPYSRYWWCIMPNGSPKPGCPSFYANHLFSHPLGYTLAACCNPWPGCGGPPCPYITWDCRLQKFVGIKMDTAELVVIGGEGVIGDELVVISDMLDGAIDLMQVTLLGTGIPELALASETVEFSHLPHQALGHAQMSATGDHLTISNIGSSGEDGVSIDLDEAVEWGVNFDPALMYWPVGSAFGTTASGSIGGGTGSGIGSAALGVVGSDALEFRCDFSPLGAESYTVVILDDGAVVLTETGLSEAFTAVVSTTGITPQPIHLGLHGDGDDAWTRLMLSEETGEVIFTGPFGSAQGDEVLFIAEDVDNTVDYLARIDLRANDVQILTIPGESRIAVASGLCEDFDSYAEDYLVGQGPWNPWAGDTAAADFEVTSVEAHSAPYSVAIDGLDDAVRQFDGYTSGLWQLTAWTFVPSTLDDSQYFILMNRYPADTLDLSSWSLQLEIDGVDGVIRNFDHGDSVPYIVDQWVPIDVIVDLDDDSTTVFYDDQLIGEYSWTAGVEAGGESEIAAIDLFANGSTSTVFYDDICLVELVPPANPADVNGDGVVDVLDLLAILAAWGQAGGVEDINGDGIVDVLDLLAVLAAWGS